jgi:hypothetical protein
MWPNLEAVLEEAPRAAEAGEGQRDRCGCLRLPQRAGRLPIKTLSSSKSGSLERFAA